MIDALTVRALCPFMLVPFPFVTFTILASNSSPYYTTLVNANGLSPPGVSLQLQLLVRLWRDAFDRYRIDGARQ